MKEVYTREEVLLIIEEIKLNGSIVLENNTAEELLDLAEIEMLTL